VGKKAKVDFIKRGKMAINSRLGKNFLERCDRISSKIQVSCQVESKWFVIPIYKASSPESILL
jgi:hypothetical protein